MKRFLKIGIVVIFAHFVLNTTALGADADHRFMHNDHDTLIIGKIIEMDDNELVIQAADFVVSANDLDRNNIRKQLRPEIARVLQCGWTRGAFQVGDYVIASLIQVDDMFGVAWGIYIVDSLDYQTLTVETLSSEFSAMYTDFVNSGGRFTTFSIAQGRVVRRYGNTEIVIYDSNPQELPEDEELEIVIYDSDPEEGEAVPAEVEDSPESTNYFMFGLISVGIIFITIVGTLAFRKSKRPK